MNKEVNEKFLEICDVLQKPSKKEDATNGFYWQLDYSAIYGGYVVHSVNVQGGGVYCVFGMARRSKKEMLAFMDGFLQANFYLKSKKND
jgi:hypothetical protein